MGPTETLAQFVVDTRLGDIPPKAVEISKLVILDVLGVTLAASRQTIARILNDYLREAAAAPRAGVIGSDLRTERALAAWANGALAFALDFDDNIHGSTHTVPAALALGEGNHATASEVSVTYFAYPESQKTVEMHPKIAPNGSIRDADDYRRKFPDGRIGSDPSQATPEKGQRIVEAAAKALIGDFQGFMRVS